MTSTNRETPPVVSLGAIQLTNAIVGAGATVALYYLRSPAAGLSCLLAVAVVIGNLYLLAALGRLLLAGTASGRRRGLGVIALPLKLLLVAGLIFLLFHRVGLDPLGFALGVATQMAAVLIQTARVAARDGMAGFGSGRRPIA